MKCINFQIENGIFKVSIDPVISQLIPPNEFPLKFRVEDWLTSDIYYQTELGPSWWAVYDNLSYKNFCVYTKSGKLLKKLTFDPYNDTSEIEEIFNIWISSRQRTNGLVLGAGTGRWGEWLLPVLNNECKVVLVEGDPNNIDALNQSHATRSNVVIENCVVSESGGKVQFWVAPQNMVSSLDRNIVEKFWPDVDINFVEVESKSINMIIQEHIGQNLNWIRIDLEGLDHKILMSLELSLVPNLEMVMFENMNISQQEIFEIKEKLKTIGLQNFIDVGIDTICFQ